MGTKSDILKRGGAPVHLSLSFLHVQLRLYSFLTYMTHVSKYVSNRLHQVKYFKCYCYNHTTPGCIKPLPNACQAMKDIQAALLVWIFMMFAHTLMEWLWRTQMVQHQYKMLEGFLWVKLTTLKFHYRDWQSPENSPQYKAELQTLGSVIMFQMNSWSEGWELHFSSASSITFCIRTPNSV